MTPDEQLELDLGPISDLDRHPLAESCSMILLAHEFAARGYHLSRMHQAGEDVIIVSRLDNPFEDGEDRSTSSIIDDSHHSLDEKGRIMVGSPRIIRLIAAVAASLPPLSDFHFNPYEIFRPVGGLGPHPEFAPRSIRGLDRKALRSGGKKIRMQPRNKRRR